MLRKAKKLVRCCYYTCSVCGRQISSYDYYTYGRCNNCRW